jgi:Molybdopterin oxidoreductase
MDLYVSDTASFAHYVLPAATMYEKGGLHFLTSNFEPYPFIEWKPKVVEPRGEALSEWEIFQALSRAAAVHFLNDPVMDWLGRALGALGVGFSEELLYRYLVFGKLSLGRLKQTSAGVKLGDIHWGEFLARGVRTDDGKLRPIWWPRCPTGSRRRSHQVRTFPSCSSPVLAGWRATTRGPTTSPPSWRR